MNNIIEITLKLPPIIAVSLETHKRSPQLYPIRDITYHLQMSYFWLKEANAEMKSLTQSVVLTEEGQGEEHKLVIPTLIGTPEQLKYMKEQLREVSNGTLSYVNDTPLPSGVKYKMEQSYNNLMMALFNADLSTQYYGQLINYRE